MTTRERKPRNVTDSPVSSVSDSAPTTPTLRGRGNRGARGRGRSRVARGRTASNTTDTTNNDDNESTQSIEDEQSGKQTPQPRAPSRASTIAKEENDETKSEDGKSKSPVKTPAATKPVSRRSRNVVAVVPPTNTRARRSNAGTVRRGGIVKRRTLPAIVATPRPRSGGAAGRRSLPIKAGIKGEAAKEKQKPGRKRGAVLKKKDIVLDKDIFKKPAGIAQETVDGGAATDTELTSLGRRRSSSKSTDTVASCPENIDTTVITSVVDVKQETVEDDGTDPVQKLSILEKMAENFSEAKVEDLEISLIKRGGRPRRATVSKEPKPNIRDVKKVVDTRTSNTELLVPKTLESADKKNNDSLAIETEEIRIVAGTEVPKDSSLSPQLDSEGVSEISVKTFYGEPAFLENNLGIEKDPKLGEIVQVQKNVITDNNEPKAVMGPQTIDKPIDFDVKQLSEQNIVKVVAETEPIKEDFEENIENTPTPMIAEEVAATIKSANEIRDKQENEEILVTNDDEGAALFKEKEKHFLSLGLLTHKAAVQAANEKIRLREMRSRNGSTKAKNRGGGSTEYTGTLKTIIKLNRTSPDKRRTRMPLKMTIHKGKLKPSHEKDVNGSENAVKQTFYIQTDKQEDQEQQEGSHIEKEKGRKGHNRSHNDVVTVSEVADANKEEKSVALVIPEKASSFKVHPDRLCLDQCFFCGGKFGLYDTPCHIAQMKSVERQDKILKSEEKLTRDSCLCDACFRHVDRKANSPSYQKRLSLTQSSAPHTVHSENDSQPENKEIITQHQNKTERDVCCVHSCMEAVAHSLRKKWITKMKKQVSKIIDIDNDLVKDTTIPICDTHYQAISHLMICAMCKRRLPKNHIHFIAHDIKHLERLLLNQGVPMNLGDVSLIVCKICRYYANLLLKPIEEPKANFIRTYSKRLLQQINLFNENEAEKVKKEHTPKATVQLREHRKLRKADDSINLSANEGPDISIIPSKLIPTNTSTPAAGHIMLDNDVMVDYDTPILEHVIHKKPNRLSGQKAKAPVAEKDKTVSEMAKALKANPNISMRELFPGEEEMGLHVNIPFGLGTTRTPEGWTRVQTMMQYDEDTRMLWEELQKPYGNQSSFIRHLILLEKYYRNGDLILSPNASSNAISYSESMQNRLRSYDNLPSVSTSSDSLNILQQLSNAPITIIPTGKNKQRAEQKTGGEKRKHSLIDGKRMKLQPNKMIKIDEQKSFPPDLISINPGTSSQHAQKSPPNVTVTPSNRKSPGNSNQHVIKLPDTLTPSERKQTAKSWRPTLIPITPGSSAAINSGPLYQTADGRKLPGLVQVMSGGKPYHISIHDYNRMCILRREKLWQIQQQQRDGSSSNTPQKDPASNVEVTKNCSMQLPNQLLEQNSLIPISNTGIPKAHIPRVTPTKDRTSSAKSTNGTSLLKNFVPIAPKLPTNTSLLPVPPAVSITNNKVNNASTLIPASETSLLPLPPAIQTIASTSATISSAAGSSAIDALIKSQMQNNMWLWGEGLNSNTPNMINNSGGSILVDNSVLSKIPKSLTVIAQQRGRSSHDSPDDATNV